MNHQSVREHSVNRRESFTELLGEILDHSTVLVRDEVELIKQEAREEVQHLSKGAIKVAIGAAVLLVALIALSAALIILLTYYLKPEIAALLTGIGLGLLGLILVSIGVRQLKKRVTEAKETILH
jgi:protein-S-isoprenylcysteine O-methyltransferase Ste14